MSGLPPDNQNMNDGRVQACQPIDLQQRQLVVIICCSSDTTHGRTASTNRANGDLRPFDQDSVVLMLTR